MFIKKRYNKKTINILILRKILSILYKLYIKWFGDNTLARIQKPGRVELSPTQYPGFINAGHVLDSFENLKHCSSLAYILGINTSIGANTLFFYI